MTTFLQECKRKHDQREAKRNAIPRIKNWASEYHKRELAWYDTIPQDGSISYDEHQANFPYGPSIYRDTTKRALDIYRKFIKNNKIQHTYARATEIQETLI